MNEKDFDAEFEVVLTAQELNNLYGVYSLEDLENID